MFSNNPVGSAKLTCPPPHWIELYLRRVPDSDLRPSWWPKTPTAYYAKEAYSAEITDGHHDALLSIDGWTRYDSIPAGVCEFQFKKFYWDIEWYFNYHLK